LNMTPAEALSHLNKGDPEGIVPALYRNMSPAVLRALADEMGPDPASPAEPSDGARAVPVETLLRRAIARPGRLRTPARRQVAFLQHYAGCRSLEEAASLASIDRRTVTRWRKASPVFNRRLCRLKQATTERRIRGKSRSARVREMSHVPDIEKMSRSPGHLGLPAEAPEAAAERRTRGTCRSRGGREMSHVPDIVPRSPGHLGLPAEAPETAAERRTQATCRYRGDREMSHVPDIEKMPRSPGHLGLSAEAPEARAQQGMSLAARRGGKSIGP
jgi:hypothetical protein